MKTKTGHRRGKRATRRGPLGATIGSVLTVLALNLLILGYAMWTASPRAEAGARGGSTATISNTGAEAPSPLNTETAGIHEESSSRAEDIELLEEEDDWFLEPLRVVNVPDLPSAQEVRQQFLRHCSGCHGSEGRGDGPASEFLLPPPRNFLESAFRYSSPWEDRDHVLGDLERTIELGVPRSAMQGFGGVLSESEIAGLSRYILELREQGESESLAEGIEDVGKRPPLTPALVERGQELFATLACNTCHGDSGRGDGINAAALVDFQGRPVRPADFTSGLFKTGQTPDDLAISILRGVPGTPMVAYEAAIAQENDDETLDIMDAWALVAYIRNLAPRVPPPGIASGAEIRVQPAADDDMLDDPGHVAWLGVRPTLVRVKPLVTHAESTTFLEVRAVHDGERIAICLDWWDETLDFREGGDLYPDALSLTFGVGDQLPPLPLGIVVEDHPSTDPVNIWQWSAARQITSVLGEGQRPVESWQPAPTDWYLFSSDPGGGLSDLIATDRPESDAPAVGSPRETDRIGSDRPIIERTALGLGPPIDQAAEQQHADATAVWSGGKWRVVMTRPLRSHEDSDVQFTTGERIPVAFCITKGAQTDDIHSIKLDSGWHWLVVFP